MIVSKNLACALALGALVSLPLAGATAQEHHGGGFYGRSFHSFSPHELHAWQGGRWIHDWHDGRYAWWWAVDGWWYFYPEPIYPYPLYVPPAVVVEQMPPVPTGLPPLQSWYYCDNPQGYYPYVASCQVPWRTVPATPPAGTAPPAPPTK
jgi:hypothetical protein